MQIYLVPLLLFLASAAALSVGVLVVGKAVGPSRQGTVKQMPYESGMDPIHSTHRRFDIHFHLVAIAFLVFDVELLFLYPWAVAALCGMVDAEGRPAGIDGAVAAGWVDSRHIVFGGVMVFFAMLVAGFVYDWRKGLFRWR